MHSPTHPGEIILEAIQVQRWTVTEAAAQLGITRSMLSRVLNRKAGVSPGLALALERLGWSDASHWMRMQVAYDLAEERKVESTT